MTPKPTAADIRAYHLAHECGLHEAKRKCLAIWKATRLLEIRIKAVDIQDEQCRDVVVEMLDWLAEPTQ